MRPLGTIVVGVAGIALWALLLTAAGRNLADSEAEGFEIEDMPVEWAEPNAPADAAAEQPAASAHDAPEISVGTDQPADAQAPPTEDTAAATEEAGVRPVNPDLFASPLAAEPQKLERIEPRAPLDTGELETERVKVVLLPRPESVAAGLIAFGPRNLKLADIATTDRMRMCPTAKGGDWPCGMVARTQQRLFLRNRTIACETDSADWKGMIEARCRVGELDIAKWLAENGWAEAPAGSPLAALTNKARTERRGLFGNDQR
ncbi:thermonuclease family protein [Ciceribacter selenitireducens]